MVKAPDLGKRGTGAFFVGVDVEPGEPKWEPSWLPDRTRLDGCGRRLRDPKRADLHKRARALADRLMPGQKVAASGAAQPDGASARPAGSSDGGSL